MTRLLILIITRTFIVNECCNKFVISRRLSMLIITRTGIISLHFSSKSSHATPRTLELSSSLHPRLLLDNSLHCTQMWNYDMTREDHGPPKFFYNHIIYYIILNIYFKNLMLLIYFIYLIF